MHRTAVVPAEAFELAARQHGLLTVGQLRRCGSSHNEIAGLVARGVLHRELHGVLRVAGAPAPVAHGSEQALMAVVLAFGPPIAVSHGSAARVWGCEELGEGWSDLTLPPGRSVERWCTATLHRVPLGPGDVVARRGLPVTVPVRTLADLATQTWHRTLLTRFVDHLLRCRHVGVRDLLTGVDRLGAHPARRTVAHLLDGHLEGARLDGATPGSDGESWVRRIAARAGLPALEPQHCVDLGDRLVWIDLAIPSLKIAIEFDGYTWHAGRAQFDVDRRRYDDLSAAGWRIVTITSVMSEAEVVGRIARAVAERTPPAVA